MTGTPGDIAARDQEEARADATLDRYVRALQIGTAEVGDSRAVAGMFVKVSEMPAPYVAVLLVRALRRLAAGNESVPR